jgi:hypothetical protein
MAIDPSQIAGGPSFFNQGIPASGLLYNALRQSGVLFDPSNPRIARLMRLAPALLQAFNINQAVNPGVTDESIVENEQLLRDYFMGAVTGGGRGLIQQAMRNRDPAIEQAMMLNAEGAAPSTNPFVTAMRALVTRPQDVLDLRQALVSPFMSAQQAQDLERGNALAMMGMYGKGEASGRGIMGEMYPNVKAPAPYDESAVMQAITGGVTPPPPPQGLELNPVTPALPAPAETPPLSAADQSYLDELLRERGTPKALTDPNFVPMRGQYPRR